MVNKERCPQESREEKERLRVLLQASLRHGGCGAAGRSHLVRTRPTPYPQCVFLRLQQLMEVTESPLKVMVALPTAKPISKHLRAINLCSGGCSFCSWPCVACHPRGSSVPLRTAHELCSHNPFSGACPVLHAAGNVGQAGFCDYVVLCKTIPSVLQTELTPAEGRRPRQLAGAATRSATPPRVTSTRRATAARVCVCVCPALLCLPPLCTS